MYHIWCQSVEPFDSFPRHLNLWPPKNNTPGGIVGRLIFSLCPFPDESADVDQSWCQSVQPFDSFSRLLNVWPPKTPKFPLVSWRAICLAYIHSQMNLHMCAKFGANRSRRLTASTYFWNCDPLKPPKCPWGIDGRIVFSLCRFPDESADLYQIWCQSVQPFDSLPKHLNFWPHKTPRNARGVLWGELYLAYVFICQTNPPTCTKYGANRCSRLTASPTFLNLCVTTYPPPPPPKCPLGYWGATWI